MNKVYLSLFIYLSFLFSSVINNYNSIYFFAKSPTTNALSGIHFSSSNISEIFSQPISREKNIENNYYFSFTNQYNNQIEIIQFSYCINHTNKKNLSIGFINRSISEIYNTNGAWNIENFLYPEFSDIDYSQISNLGYQDFGFVLSYNRFLKKADLSIKIKPFYNSLDSDKALGLDLDLMSYYKLKGSNISFVLGVNNFFYYKKWNNNTIEKNKKEYFLSSNINFDRLNVYFETNNIYNQEIAFEYRFQNSFYFRVGKGLEDFYTSGFGLNSNFIDLDYAYLNHNILGNTYQISLLFKLASVESLSNKIGK